MATLVGTPTNMIFLKMYKENFQASTEMNFVNWFRIGFPVSIMFLMVAFFVLKSIFISKRIELNIDRKYFNDAYHRLGKPMYEEKIVFSIFITTAILWFTRSDIPFGSVTFKGWGNLFQNSKFIDDSTVAIVMALLLFLIPSKTEKGRSLITWEEASKLPFDVILLFGGGFALAKGFELSGLSNWMASKLAFAPGTSILFILLCMCVLITIISEFASNVACIQLMIPILLSMQKVLDVHPLLLLVPATLAASLGFMLPVATAPNTIVFGSKRIKANDMMKAGFILDVAGIAIILALMAIVGTSIWK